MTDIEAVFDKMGVQVERENGHTTYVTTGEVSSFEEVINRSNSSAATDSYNTPQESNTAGATPAG